MAEPEFLREFEFLPNLPKSNLDDRTFDDLVQECILRIPRYCPEWTNHNPGDPGVTLIELFSWLVDQMLFRFNQVPRRNYVAFLELLGVRLQPPTPAHVDLTFYLIKAQNAAMRIPINTEVATVRTETEPAVVFTTEAELIIGQPKIQGLFTARHTQPQTPDTEDFVNTLLNSNDEVQWENLGDLTVFEDCRFDNCFYLVLAPVDLTAVNGSINVTHNAITGNVLTLTFKGVVAGTTGINPDDPPLQWEAWDGEQWRSQGILRQRQDDHTKGFSFHELRQQGINPQQEGADVVLHLPQQWVETDFGTGCRGHWIRCVYKRTREMQSSYSRSPIISSISVRSIGGTIHASECVRVEEELLGVSTGKPGQSFQLQGFPVLDRKIDEYIRVRLPDGQSEDWQPWQEVTDFGDSNANQPDYVIDAQTGTVQFGPLVREPSQLQRQTYERGEIQPWGKQVRRLSRHLDGLDAPMLSADLDAHQYQEWQYGKVPPIGSEIYMSAYRIGGGSRGNVQEETLKVLKTAIPYVKQVVNYQAAIGGRDAETLDEAVIRVPQILRTSQAAVTPEDYENIAKRTLRSLYRAHCPAEPDPPGVVRLLIVPAPNGKTEAKAIDSRRDFPQGMHPDRYFTLEALGRAEVEKLQSAIDRRKPLGIRVKPDVPDYVGVKVLAEVLLEHQFTSLQAREEIRAKLAAVLYRFLNPITGGFEETGWVLGRPVRPSDIVAILQDVPEVRYVGAVKLFSIDRHAEGWFVNEFPDLAIDPGALGLICSWEDDDPAILSGHLIQLME